MAELSQLAPVCENADSYNLCHYQVCEVLKNLDKMIVSAIFYLTYLDDEIFQKLSIPGRSHVFIPSVRQCFTA
jgi:hypothetical protein